MHAAGNSYDWSMQARVRALIYEALGLLSLCGLLVEHAFLTSLDHVRFTVESRNCDQDFNRFIVQPCFIAPRCCVCVFYISVVFSLSVRLVHVSLNVKNCQQSHFWQSQYIIFVDLTKLSSLIFLFFL